MTEQDGRVDDDPRTWPSREGSTRPAKGDQTNTPKLHSPTSPEEYSVLITCGDPATLDAIVNTATRMRGVRVVVENPELP